eukprot:COSAG05_NODE_882_length_6789_cov_6.646487_1_plen_68_part_10
MFSTKYNFQIMHCAKRKRRLNVSRTHLAVSGHLRCQERLLQYWRFHIGDNSSGGAATRTAQGVSLPLC